MRLDLVHSATREIVRRLWRRQMPGWPQQGFAQEGFLHDLESQGMSALVWYQLNQQQSLPRWPATVLHALREYALREVAVEILWEEETLLVLKAMAEKGIHPLLLKGAALSQAIYPQPGLRPRCDTDLLVPEAAKKEAQLAMRSLGYQPLYEARVEHISGQMTWVKPGNSGVEYSHDLHWRIRNNHRQFSNLFSHEYLQAHAKPLPRFGNEARMLNLADALLLACVHRAGHLAHSGDRLIWLHDIHLLGEGLCEEDIERFCQTARKLDLEDLCGEAFAVTSRWFATRFPPALALMRDQAASANPQSHDSVPDRAAGIRTAVQRELRGMRWNERIKYLFQNVFPPPGYMKWRYGKNNSLLLPWLYFRRLLQGMYLFIGKQAAGKR